MTAMPKLEGVLIAGTFLPIYIAPDDMMASLRRTDVYRNSQAGPTSKLQQ